MHIYNIHIHQMKSNKIEWKFFTFYMQRQLMKMDRSARKPDIEFQRQDTQKMPLYDKIEE